MYAKPSICKSLELYWNPNCACTTPACARLRSCSSVSVSNWQLACSRGNRRSIEQPDSAFRCTRGKHERCCERRLFVVAQVRRVCCLHVGKVKVFLSLACLS